MRKFQIGVMGSAADLKYSAKVEAVAEEVGKLVAKQEGILVFGAEKDTDSLSTAASRGAKSEGGITVGITYGKHKDIWESNTDIIIPCGLERGGGREFVLALSCDAIISISGGSGTLTELAIAYQSDIPIICIKGYEGWSDKLAGEYFDNRKRRINFEASSAEEAVSLAFREAKNYRLKYA